MSSQSGNDHRNLTEQRRLVSRKEREALVRQKGSVVWFTGLSGSGKSTVARLLEQKLVTAGRLAYLMDGDNIRMGLNQDLGFSAADREENIRRVGEVAALLCDAGIITLTAFISPYRKDRERARSLVPAGRFVEVFVDAPVEVCESRDPKGLYRMARAGKISDLTGIDAPYEPPGEPEIVLRTHREEADRCVEEVFAFLEDLGILRS